jgi:uncharacterized lipoprotein YajG
MRALILFLLLSVSACAWTEERVDLAYEQAGISAALPDARSVKIEVAPADARSTYRDRVSSKKNGFGMEAAAITSSNDVADLVGRSIEQGLKARGFEIGSGGSKLAVDIHKFYNDFKVGIWSGTSAAEINLAVRLLDPAGAPRFSKSYSAEGIVKPIMLMGPENARLALNKALTDAVARVVNDPDLTNALVAAGREAPEVAQRR